MDRSFPEFAERLKDLVDEHRGSVSIAVLESELQVPAARVYEAIGWLIRDGALTLDPEQRIVYARRPNPPAEPDRPTE